MSEIIHLTLESDSIKYLCKKDARLKKLIEKIGSITYETRNDSPYAFLIHEIIEQMLSIKSGQIIYQRLVNLCEGDLNPQSIDKLTTEQIRSIGTSNSKVSYIQSITKSVINNEIDLNSLNSKTDKEVFDELIKLRGIGSWTAKMFLLFVLGRQDILPTEDVAFQQSYKWLYHTNNIKKEAVEKRCKKWSPFSSIASVYLYEALDTGLTKKEDF